MAHGGYLKLAPPVENGNLTETELRLMRRSSRWVVFLSFFQMVLAIFSGSLLFWILAAIFVPLGIVGACRRRPKMLVAHFVYSIFLYILCLLGVVYLILYCDRCDWPVYLITFLIVLVQAVGMRHSRILITLIRIQEAALPVQTVFVQPQQIQMQQPQLQQSTPNGEEQQLPPQPIFYAIPMGYGQAPQYYPMPVGYPQFQPQVVMPGQEEAVYPVVYKQ